MTYIETKSDQDLVSASLAGNQNAFAEIVERYKRLLCSLAYSATGSLTESEDIAQEAFLTAWQKLDTLKEPAKLRSWLCTILRHKAGRSHRKSVREPIKSAESLDDVGEFAAQEESATHHTMKKEEQDLLWQSLESLPPNYREPLILFYREHKSVEHVAFALDLTESTVKQRLSRGRKMLQEQVMAFVEGALEKSTPGKVFTAGVMASLTVAAPPAKAAVAGAAAAQTAASAKTFGLAAMLASISGLVSTLLAIRAGLDQSRTSRERRATVLMGVGCFSLSVGIFGVLYLMLYAAMQGWASTGSMIILSQLTLASFIIFWPYFNLRIISWSQRLRTEERKRVPEAFSHPDDAVGSKKGEFKSRLKLLGIPLVHIRFSSPETGSAPAVGWIAGGDRAYGILFAWGLWAVGFISVGSCSFGVISIGAVGFGVLGLGAVGVGYLAIGAASAGYRAYASIAATGWETAQSPGFSIARTAAEGRIAVAQHANDSVAREMLANPQADLHTLIFLVGVTILTMVPITLYATEVRRRLGPKARQKTSK